MSGVRIVFYKRVDEDVPIKDWLDGLTRKDRRKCLERIERLREDGHELDRPFAAYLRDGIYELRVKSGNVNYRMLYFFHKGRAVVISHALVKKTRNVPPREIDRAAERKLEFKQTLNFILSHGSLKMKEKEMSSDAFQWAHNKYIAHDPEEVARYEEERIKADVAQAVYNIRNQAGLSRKHLADLIGVEESFIEDMEEADYEGDFLTMASRIANALHRRIKVQFVPVEGNESVSVPV